uniref:barley B recombinant-like protein A n=1 Tax=Erigeron canadensis TaxID=72917 RepID=UPI001CB923DA|nr:barley B recombinant-like protein A [Erigeron canadensis]
MVEPIDKIMNHGPEFERLVEDSWAYISKLYSRNKKPTKSLTNVPPKRPYHFVKRSATITAFGEELDISNMPPPVYSCTGIPRNYHRWDKGGCTSTCCTVTLSMYPLPSFDGARCKVRLVGRKMGHSTFTKVVEELLLAGYDLGFPIDLKDHWAKLGSNKYVVNR